MNWSKGATTHGYWALAGLAGTALAACSGTPEPLTDSVFTGSAAIADAAEPDAASSVDATASLDAESAETAPAPVVRYLGRGENFILARDAGAPSEGTGDAGGHAADGADDHGAASPDASATRPSSCVVAFSVTGALVDGLIFQQVVLGGDVPALGSGVDSAALKMMASSVPASTWSTSVALDDGQVVHFRFGMASTAPSALIAWETSGNSRSYIVSCASTSSAYVGQYGAAPDGG